MRKLLWIAVPGAVLLAFLAVPLIAATRSASSAQAGLVAAEREAQLGHKAEASRLLERAGSDAARAATRFSGPLPSIAGRIPFVGRSIRSATHITRAASAGATAARTALEVLPDRSPWSAGVVDLQALPAMERAATRALNGFEAARAEARRAPSWPVPGRLARARRDLLRRLDRTIRSMRTASGVLRILPEALGGSGVRRYFLAVQNPAELRATGGFWGNYGIIEAQNGRIRLAAFGRTSDDLGPGKLPPFEGPQWFQDRYARFGAPSDWRGLNMCPDFPTVASLAEQILDRAPEGIGPVDGVIAVDPVGLGELLKLSGPVDVAGWDVPISGDNVVRITLREAYVRFEDREQRANFLGDVAQAVWSRLLTTDVSLRPATLAGVGRAVIERRMLFHLRRDDEQRVIEAPGYDGGLGSPRETFGLVTQNAAGNKMDVWLDRSVDYRIQLEHGGSATVDARIVLRNGGPAAGEPSEVIGPYDDRFEPGVNRQYASLYVPESSTVIETESPDGLRGEVEDELRFSVFSRFVDVQPGGQVQLRYTFHVPDAWRGDRYAMVLRRQPALAADSVSLEISPPMGWGTSSPTRLRTRLTADRRVQINLRRSILARFVDLLPF